MSDCISDKEDKSLLGTFVAAVFVLLVVLASVGHLYQAHVQAEVYRREGIEISDFEVLMGAKPVERAIRIIDTEKK